MKKKKRDVEWRPDQVCDLIKRAEVEILRTGAIAYLTGTNIVLTTAGAVRSSKAIALSGEPHVEQVRIAGKNVDAFVASCDQVNDLATLTYVAPEVPRIVVEKGGHSVTLCTSPLDSPGRTVYIRKGDTWIRALATDIPGDSMVRLVPEEPVERGKWTAPVVNTSGELLALTVNFTSDPSGHQVFGLAPRLCKTLPYWIIYALRLIPEPRWR